MKNARKIPPIGTGPTKAPGMGDLTKAGVLKTPRTKAPSMGDVVKVVKGGRRKFH